MDPLTGSHTPQLPVDQDEVPVEQPPPRRPRIISAGDAPSTHTQRHGIVPPAIPNNNFEIKSSLISMLQNRKFHGLPSEDPLDHLDEFERLCSLQRLNGVSEDAFKLRLFPFSLGDKARIWEKHLPQGSITSWNACKTAFLSKFFSNSRTAKLRSAISSFAQQHSETFAEAWERYKTYQTQCPHHGYSTKVVLSNLYKGVHPSVRRLLDTASNGNFLNKDVDDGWELVENMAQADGQYNEDYDRTLRGTVDTDTVSRKELKALNEKLDKLLQVNQKHVHFMTGDEHIQVEEQDQVEEISYLQNQAGGYKQYNNYKPHPNLSYRSTNVANPQDQVYPPKPAHPQAFIPKPQYRPYLQPTANVPPGYEAPAPATATQSPEVMTMLQEILKGQKAAAAEVTHKFAEVHSKIDASHNDLNCKFETLNSRLKYVENQQASSSTVKTTGQLPGKAVPNPKEYHANAITLQSGRELLIRAERATPTEDSKVQEGEDFHIKDQHKTSTRAVPLEPETRSGTESVPLPAETHAPDAKLDTVVRVEPRSKTSDAHSPTATQEQNKPFVPPPYKPQLPFPKRLKKDLTEKYKALFDKQMKDIEVKIPLLDAFMLMPPYQNFLKEAVKERTQEVEGMVVLTHEISAIIQRKVVPKKLGDPGTFTIPCSLGPLSFSKCLCDLGASISLMPLSVAKRLGFADYKSCRISLVLADRSVRIPHGILEDLPVKVGGVEIPIDFIVLEMEEEPTDPLLFGRPFLATSGALIDV